MLIQCPKCERKGDIPDRFGLTPHSVRCRTCRTQFTTVPLTDNKKGNRLSTPLDETPDAEILVNLSRPRSPLFRADVDVNEIGPLLDVRGPGDSHYEWPVIREVDIDDSQVEIPAFSADDPESSDELPTLAPDPPSEEILVAESSQFASASLFARYRIAIATLIRLVSLAILGFFVFQVVSNAQTVGTSIMALVVGCLALASLLLLSMTLGPHPRLVSAFTHSVHHAGSRSDLDRPIPSD